MYNTWTDTHGRTNSYRHTGWHSLIYLYHKLLSCLYVPFYPTVTVITPHISPSAMPWFRNPDVSDDPISLRPGSPALGSWFENLLGDKSTPLLLSLLFASLHRLAAEFKTQNSTACTTVSYFTVQTGEPHHTWKPLWEKTDTHTEAACIIILKCYCPYILIHSINLDVLKSPQKQIRKSQFHDIFDWIH